MTFFNFFTALLLAIVFALGRVEPTEGNYLWLVPFLIPLALALNFILLFVMVVRRKKSGAYYLVSLGLAMPYMVSTVGVKHFVHATNANAKHFSVLNYNVSLTGFPYVQSWAFYTPPTLAFQMKDWILNQDADIQCYQEFMTFNGEQNFDMLKLLADKGYHCYLSTDRKKPNEPTVGVLIASRFPIVKSGDVAASENGFNRIAFADVLVQHDTVRIISLHLESMGLRQYNPAKAWSIGSAVAKVGLILNQLEAGMNERNRQIKKLTGFIRASPHRVVCTGDFNDLPYAFPYQALKKQLHNTFEEAGHGFGFTYNGSTLRMLRIDNQFYSPGLTPTTFKTLNTVTLSDHFPLLGTYTLTERR